ncbi:hypothetical protein D3C87_1859390 [compost metagenome]
MYSYLQHTAYFLKHNKRRLRPVVRQAEQQRRPVILQECFCPDLLGLVKAVPSFKNQSLLFTVKKDLIVLGNHKLRIVEFTAVPIVNLVVVIL